MLAIGFCALPAALYVYRYVAQSPFRTDKSLTKEDFAWRSPARFGISSIFLIIFAGLAVFTLIRDAPDDYWSQGSMLVILTALGVFCVHDVVQSLFEGEITPLIRPPLGPYSRSDQPRLYWASMAWNSFMVCLFVFLAFQLWTEGI